MKKQLDNSTVTSFAEQQKMNETNELNFDELRKEFDSLVASIPGADDPNGQTEEGLYFQNYWQQRITQIIEKNLGKGKKVSQCNSNQVEALLLIISDLKELINNQGEE